MNKRKRALPRGWYPADKNECQREIESYLEGWSPSQLPLTKGLGGIVPHAGWYFSGKLAARVFYALKLKSKADVVVLYGGHLSIEDLPRIVMEEACETPFGDMEVDTGFVKDLMGRMDVKKESPSSGDNTVEIQLAMVKYFFPEAKLVAIRSPLSMKAETLGREVAEVAKKALLVTESPLLAAWSHVDVQMRAGDVDTDETLLTIMLTAPVQRQPSKQTLPCGCELMTALATVRASASKGGTWAL